MIKFITGLLAGTTYQLRAIIFLRQTPELRHYIIMPIIINVIVGITLYIGLLITGSQGIDAVINNLSLPSLAKANGLILPIIELILRILLGLGLLLSTGFVLVQFGVVLGAPWYGMLSEQIEKIRTGKLPPNQETNILTIGRDVGRAILHEFKKFMLLIALGIPLFIMGFFPPFGTLIASFGWILLSATLLCIDFFDAPLERRKFRFRHKLGILRQHLPATATFGLMCLLLVSIPLLNLLSIPLCVTAGTLFFCDRILPQL